MNSGVDACRFHNSIVDRYGLATISEEEKMIQTSVAVAIGIVVWALLHDSSMTPHAHLFSRLHLPTKRFLTSSRGVSGRNRLALVI